MLYAVMDGGQMVARRDIENWDTYPAHKKEARDEKGDGGPTLRPLYFEGEGPVESAPVIEPDRVRIQLSPAPAPDPTPDDRDAIIAALIAKIEQIEAKTDSNTAALSALAEEAVKE